MGMYSFAVTANKNLIVRTLSYEPVFKIPESIIMNKISRALLVLYAMIRFFLFRAR